MLDNFTFNSFANERIVNGNLAFCSNKDFNSETSSFSEEKS